MTANPANIPTDIAALQADASSLVSLAAKLANDVGMLVADYPPPAPPPPPANPITIPAQSLPAATVGTTYSATLKASSTAGTIVSWQTIDANGNALAYLVPAPGLAWGGVNAQTPGITITGVPTTAGSTTFTFRVSDSAGNAIISPPYTLAIAPAPPPPPPPPVTGSAQIVVGGWVQNDPALTGNFVKAFNANPAKSVMMAFGYGADWATVQSSDVGMAGALGSWPGIRCLAVPMQTTGAPGAYTDVTSGANDGVFTAIASACAANGVTLIRLGWEYQNNPSGNMPAPVPTASFRATFDHIVTVMRAVNSNLRFIFNPNDGTNGGDSPDYLSVLPTTLRAGDIVALDAYDNNSGWPAALSGATPNLTQISALAAAHGFDLALPEWSCIPAGASYSSGDQPTFIDDTWAWAKAQVAAGRNVYLMAWGDGYPGAGTWGLQCSPNALAELGKLVTAGQATGLVAS